MLSEKISLLSKIDYVFKIDWDEATQTITGTKNGLQIRMTVNSTKATINGTI
ncbi:stalk domain-containing protein [Paenibacillus sp. N3.4]|uniref:stalk domain-containing protein n=1 Tax=Paenibacillus sp. N3.4 TaxID=2603222 RepID=UPI0011CA46D1|nr:stalk domain-containing protein [Paenibacillus sp. N3.4]TXK74518.1 hypothetical protein FU659_29190 [Paenibacillus sp. N3.4]